MDGSIKRLIAIVGYGSYIRIQLNCLWMCYLITFLIIQIYLANKNEFWQWKSFTVALFWGIGILSHGISVFGSNLLFDKNWEDRKIKELMDKDKKSNL